MYGELFIILILSSILTILFWKLFPHLGGNLYSTIRGGTPRAVGLAPYITLLIFFPVPGKMLIGIIGLFAFIDDLLGRKQLNILSIELGQLSRGLGMIVVILIGYFYFGATAILIALMIQPMNIADMQPGTACSTMIIMGIITALAIFLATGNIYYPALVLLAACLGYAPLDYQGRIMMGEVGNHSFAVGLGIIYTALASFLTLNSAPFHGWEMFGTFLTVFVLLIITAFLIAFLRRENLRHFIEYNLLIPSPTFGDYTMDVLTGGGLGDLLRRILLGKRKIIIKSRILKVLGFRRLIHNPY
jgi:UDP-GlcNAc:undecaprenyl-phosphate/decaprenyl-phosphate GlcNAc-1-phosphate transferase